jgi:glycerophosphoryl diester phosphodiesterase
MAAFDWLVARPIAHRGLHDRALGVIENTPSAVARALEHGFSVEIDVQMTGDGDAVVFHDATLDRLTEATGRVSGMPLQDLRRVVFRETADRIWTLDDCLDLIGGRQALVVEIKSDFDGDMRLARLVADRLRLRGGPVAAKSFDPRAVRAIAASAPRLPRGIVGEAFADDDAHWAGLSGAQRFAARNILHWPLTRPHFLSWHVRDLGRRAVRLARAAGLPVMTWTVRTPEDQAHAALCADQMVFEGFMPDGAVRT